MGAKKLLFQVSYYVFMALMLILMYQIVLLTEDVNSKYQTCADICVANLPFDDKIKFIGNNSKINLTWIINCPQNYSTSN